MKIQIKNIFLLVIGIFVFGFAIFSCKQETEAESTYYTVSFDSDGGSAVKSQSVEAGKFAVEPDEPSKNEFTFAGWYNEDTLFDFSKPVTTNLTLKAKWTAVSNNDGNQDKEEQGTNNESSDKEGNNSGTGTQDENGGNPSDNGKQNENDNKDSEETEHEHTFSTLWVYDENYHWHATTCGHSEPTLGKELHTWDYGEITKLPTKNECGYKKFTCSICNATKSVSQSYEESDLYLDNDTLYVNSIPQINGYKISINNYIPASGKVYITSKCDDISMISCTNVKSLVISNGVENISDNAFAGCSNLEEVNLQNGLKKIGKYAFGNCINLESISIPNTVSEIGETVFWGCVELKSIILSNSITKIENNTFRGCSSLTEIEIPNSVTSIGSAVFVGCTNLGKVIMHDNVIEIDSAAFPDNITELEIGDSIQYDRSSIGMMSGLKKVKITMTNATTIGKHTFWGCNNLTDVQIVRNHNEKIIIDDDAFCVCDSLKDFPFDIVGEIKNSSFLGCGFESLDLTAKSIGNNAFAGCKMLRTINLNHGVETLGEGAFYNLSHATTDGIKTINVYISNTVKSIEKYNFFNCCNTYLKFEDSGKWHTTVILPDSTYEYDNTVESNRIYEVSGNYGAKQYEELPMFATGDTYLVDN